MSRILTTEEKLLLPQPKEKKWCVQVLEMHHQDVLIDAATAVEAIKKVAKDKGTQSELYYDYTLDSDEWVVFEIK